MFDPITLKLSVDPLILSALKEDVTSEDVTTNSVMREACMGQVDLISPNNRIFEKYSVRVGGGNNHRYNLTDGILLKDNHIGAAGSVEKAIQMAKEYAPFVRKIEVEVESLDMVRQAVEAGADIIMLDNMDHDELMEELKLKYQEM